MREIISFDKPIIFDELVIPQNLNLNDLKIVPYKIGEDGEPELKPGEACQSPDKKIIFCQAHED